MRGRSPDGVPSIRDPLDDAIEDAIEEDFDELEVNLGGIGEIVGWDADADGVQLHSDEPERVIALLVDTLHRLPVQTPSRLISGD